MGNRGKRAAKKSGSWTVDAGVVFDPNAAFRPLVSVVILSHRPEFKAQAEASVRAQTLWKTGMVEIVTKESPTYWGGKINEVIAGASGHFIVPLCDDDLLGDVTALEEWVTVFAQHPTVDFCYSDIWLFGGPDGDRRLELPDWHPHEPTQRCVPWVTAMYRRELLTEHLYDRVGYDPNLQYWDWDFAKRLGKMAKVGHRIPKPMFWAREHAMNGHKHMNHGLAYIKMYVKHDVLEGPKPLEPEFLYPPYREDRSPLLDEDELKLCPAGVPVSLLPR